MKQKAKEHVLEVIKNKKSPPERVRNAFAYLFNDPDKENERTVVGEAIHALYEHHPRIAEELVCIIPERFIPKPSACDGCP